MRNLGIAAFLVRTLGVPGLACSRSEAGIVHLIFHRGIRVSILNGNAQVFRNRCEIARNKARWGPGVGGVGGRNYSVYLLMPVFFSAQFPMGYLSNMSFFYSSSQTNKQIKMFKLTYITLNKSRPVDALSLHLGEKDHIRMLLPRKKSSCESP